MNISRRISLICIFSIIFILVGGCFEVKAKININNEFENKEINFNKITILDGMSQSSAQYIFKIVEDMYG